jgi:hypothetical protein
VTLCVLQGPWSMGTIGGIGGIGDIGDPPAPVGRSSYAPYARLCFARAGQGVGRFPHFPAASCRVRTKPPARVPAS